MNVIERKYYTCEKCGRTSQMGRLQHIVLTGLTGAKKRGSDQHAQN